MAGGNYGVRMCLRLAFRALALAGRRPWFAFLILCFGLAMVSLKLLNERVCTKIEPSSIFGRRIRRIKPNYYSSKSCPT